MRPEAIAIIVLMICCVCSSSVGAYFLIPSEADPDPGPSGPSGPSGAAFTYDVHIVSNTENDISGSVISDIKIDGNRVSKDEITFHITPTNYDCEHDTQDNWDCKGDMGYLDGDGAITMAAWNKHNPPEKFFTITSDKKIGEIEISFHRPTYAPALMIKENGVEILRDDSNKGNEGSPSPYPVTYTI